MFQSRHLRSSSIQMAPTKPTSSITLTSEPSWFEKAEFVPPDAIFALTAQYIADPSPLKCNLGQGCYRSNEGQPWVLPSVQRAREQLLSQGLNHEYLPILGLADFRALAAEVALSPEIFADKEKVSC